MAERVFEIISKHRMRVIYSLVLPIDRNTPRSHIESLMLAPIVVISIKAPRLKQMMLDTVLSISTTTSF